MNDGEEVLGCLRGLPSTEALSRCLRALDCLEPPLLAAKNALEVIDAKEQPPGVRADQLVEYAMRISRTTRAPPEWPPPFRAWSDMESTQFDRPPFRAPFPTSDMLMCAAFRPERARADKPLIRWQEVEPQQGKRRIQMDIRCTTQDVEVHFVKIDMESGRRGVVDWREDGKKYKGRVLLEMPDSLKTYLYARAESTGTLYPSEVTEVFVDLTTGIREGRG
uniref:Uncharacterized protein n=1 Tax=Chromera velia CCMP2878 TaxID=1169474 RepID=A0A0G4HP20_9ALVE|mmetsp:Transcript_33439/g.66302  ORF Transcript_33439/g.66302 Transcript_33439/m.66302 type:complete len:221 (+) Transcript_33439:323-985(+)|eukprot:Cvel_29689.t1-p1 / transcript=Cvel_29689.t1 / gene=Cvel_29689 / organism=Chromera_velia_CCMP2878 / gene_product=hypothetical protein / transcript_product=hypothetical protein / location=Cvel_scaffold4110:1031-4492(-) / protein_length=220 / sequence_SO=supercontig / SO=protein_coding / is_pseudo=false